MLGNLIRTISRPGAGDTISQRRLPQVPLLAPAAGLIADFLSRLYGPDFRNRLHIVVVPSDVARVISESQPDGEPRNRLLPPDACTLGELLEEIVAVPDGCTRRCSRTAGRYASAIRIPESWCRGWLP